VFKLLIILSSVCIAIPCSAEFRDPTQPPYSLPSTETDSDDAVADIELVLSAIMISSKSRRAIINGINVKEGQTIEIEQQAAPPLNPRPAAPANTPASKTPSGTTANAMNSSMKPELLDKLMTIAPMQFAPLLETATKSLDVPQLQEPNLTSSSPQQPDTSQQMKAIHIPVPPTTIKIVRIDKNSVIIDQNGELKTLQLVQRSYNNTARNKYRVNL
jgi:hypothetical protein